MREKIFRELQQGFITLHILHHAAKEPIFGQEFKEELARHGYDVSFGTLYPLFHRLEESGLLSREERNEGGRVRKYYRATEAGAETLEAAKSLALELVEELNE